MGKDFRFISDTEATASGTGNQPGSYMEYEGRKGGRWNFVCHRGGRDAFSVDLSFEKMKYHDVKHSYMVDATLLEILSPA